MCNQTLFDFDRKKAVVAGKSCSHQWLCGYGQSSAICARTASHRASESGWFRSDNAILQSVHVHWLAHDQGLIIDSIF